MEETHTHTEPIDFPADSKAEAAPNLGLLAAVMGLYAGMHQPSRHKKVTGQTPSGITRKIKDETKKRRKMAKASRKINRGKHG